MDRSMLLRRDRIVLLIHVRPSLEVLSEPEELEGLKEKQAIQATLAETGSEFATDNAIRRVGAMSKSDQLRVCICDIGQYCLSL